MTDIKTNYTILPVTLERYDLIFSIEGIENTLVIGSLLVNNANGMTSLVPTFGGYNQPAGIDPNFNVQLEQVKDILKGLWEKHSTYDQTVGLMIAYDRQQKRQRANILAELNL